MSNFVVLDSSISGALTVLRGVNKQLDKVSEQVSSTKVIETAADDPTYWSMSQTMQSDSDSLKTVSDALNLGAGKVDTAYTGLTSAIDIVTSIRAKLVSATEAGVDRSQINQDIANLKQQLQTIASSATFSGDNWLINSSASLDANKSIIANFNRTPSGQVYTSSISYDSRESLLIDTSNPANGWLTKNITNATSGSSYHLLNASGTGAPGGLEISISSATTDGQLSDMLSAVSSILASINSAAAKLGIMKSQVDNQSTFVDNLTTTLKTTIGSLVDTDMEEASAKQTALQTAQQIGLQSISIANSMSSKILLLLQK